MPTSFSYMIYNDRQSHAILPMPAQRRKVPIILRLYTEDQRYVNTQLPSPNRVSQGRVQPDVGSISRKPAL